MAVSQPPMSNRKIQAKEAIQKRLRNPEAVLGKMKKSLADKKRYLAQFMEMSEEEKRILEEEVDRLEREIEREIKRAKERRKLGEGE